MTEIRPIRTDEGDEFLDLLCRVFGLDIERARSIFYSEPMFELKRKWALFEGKNIVSILTTVPLQFGWGRAFGIAGVATREDRRGEGLAGELLERVITESAAAGETAAYLFAKELGVYRKNGFEVLDEVIRGPLEREEEVRLPNSIDLNEVMARYNRWSAQNPHRLLRDERRWRYWQWNLRMCSELDGGYVCSEGGLIREVVHDGPLKSPLVLPGGSEWIGLSTMSDALGLKVADPKFELYLMARNAPAVPQLFMTDQF